MPAPKPRRWVVLIQRRPRGPMGEPEIQALLNQGMIRTNDLAFEVSPENGKALTDWKMLWQFEEFDRRAKKAKEEAANASLWGTKPPPEAERRNSVPDPAKIKAKVKEALPEELLDISPEDLIPRPGTTGPGSKLPKLEEETPAEVSAKASGGGHASLRWAGMALAAMAAVGIISQWISFPKNLPMAGETEREVTTLAPSAPNTSSPPANYQRSLPPRPSINPPVAREERFDPPPSRRDKGELSSDPRNDREEDDFAEEDDAVAEDFAFESGRKPATRKKLKRAAPAEEEGEEVIEPREGGPEPIEEEVD